MPLRRSLKSTSCTPKELCPVHWINGLRVLAGFDPLEARPKCRGLASQRFCSCGCGKTVARTALSRFASARCRRRAAEARAAGHIFEARS